MREKKLLRIPSLQVALDTPNAVALRRLLGQIHSGHDVILEAGTPLIKKYGLRIIRDIRKQIKDAFIIADLKTLDVGQLEARLAYEDLADGATVAGTARIRTVQRFLRECRRLGMWGIIDMVSVRNPIGILKSMGTLPDIVVIHRAIDEGPRASLGFPLIRKIKKSIDSNLLVAIAGGMNAVSAKIALDRGADIIIVGRYVTQSSDPRGAVRKLLSVIYSTARPQLP